MDVPVLIVGAGPVGLALAGDLGWRGVPCLLIEKSDGVITQPKMDLVGYRTMEFCRRWGIVDWVEGAPYPRDYSQDYVYVTSLTGYELGREPFPTLDETLCPPQSPQHRERCPQDMFDPVLRRFASSFDDVIIRYESEMVGLEENDDGVRVEVRDHRAQTSEVINAKYVVGCDGASSAVRHALGISMSGEATLTYTTNIIFRSVSLPELHDKGLAYRFICVGPEGTYATIVAINGNDRWRLSYIGGPDKKMLTQAEIGDLIVRAVGKPFDYEVLSVVPWTRRELVADAYGSKRVFIAGDAAHMMSPTGGFGMNTGIGDAVDLSWKLDAVLSGWGGPGLLASYEVERRPVAIRNVREATDNLVRMLSAREKLPAPAVFSEGADGDRARKEYGKWFSDQMRPEWYTIGIHLGYRYDDSPICWRTEEPPPLNPVATYEQTSLPGARAPHVWLGEGRSTLDLFGKGFVLLRVGRDAPSGDVLAEAAARAGVSLTVTSCDVPEAVEAYERALVLVRPDGHVAWRGDVEPVDPDTVIRRVVGGDAYASDAPYGATEDNLDPQAAR